uniref:Uncharacterized protein n=1 Tax=Oryza meridionalis TaxID=40149 RepID=A0A0E0CAQ5_9ORYZ
MGFENHDDVDDVVGEVVNDGDGLARRRSEPRLSAFFTLENPGLAYENRPVNASANLPLVVEPSSTSARAPLSSSSPRPQDRRQLRGQAPPTPSPSRAAEAKAETKAAVGSNPSQTLIHTPMPLPKSTRPSVTASPELIKAQTAEFAVEISISSELKRTTILHPPQKRQRLPPNRIVSCNT